MCIPKNYTAIPIAIGMQQIRSKNTKPEMLVRKFLHANGFRYRLHGGNPAAAKAIAGKPAAAKAIAGKPAAAKALAGRPDIVLPKYRTVIFVHACRPCSAEALQRRVGRAASGMAIPIAKILWYPKPVPNGGPIK
jgi:G:T-mismatch repair DNA endonuclease (very short patch repair protein)